MAKKPVQQAQPQEEDVQEDPVEDESDALGDLDFNVEDEFKPDPLIPKGTYHGVVNKTTFNGQQYCIVWDVCLHDNGGAMTDGSTPIDGAHVFFRNWLPRPGDESLMTGSGRSTKRQSKINMLKKFEEEIGVDMSTPQKIALALSEQQWVGIEVDVEIDVDEYNGVVRNVANRLKRSTL